MSDRRPPELPDSRAATWLRNPLRGTHSCNSPRHPMSISESPSPGPTAPEIDDDLCCCGYQIGTGGDICHHGGCRSYKEYIATSEAEKRRAPGPTAPETIEEALTDLHDAGVECGRNHPEEYTGECGSEAARARVLSLIEELREDAERWKWAKAGLFITTSGGKHDPEVVYQSGHLDEFAQQMWDSLPKDGRGNIVWDVTPVIDAARAARTQERSPNTEEQSDG